MKVDVEWLIIAPRIKWDLLEREHFKKTDRI